MEGIWRYDSLREMSFFLYACEMDLSYSSIPVHEVDQTDVLLNSELIKSKYLRFDLTLDTSCLLCI